MRELGARNNSLVSDSPSASPWDNRKLVSYMRAYPTFSYSLSYWRASEACETLSGLNNGNGRYIYLITLIPRNITSQLQCISASAAGTSAIPVIFLRSDVIRYLLPPLPASSKT